MTTQSTTPGATHDVTTEHGVRKPNGEEQWNTTVHTLPSHGSISYRHLKEVHENQNYRRDFIRHLEATAGEVGVDKAEYVSGHRLITRQRITVILPAVDADPTVQLGSNDKDVPWL